jgi:hypothetical protein
VKLVWDCREKRDNVQTRYSLSESHARVSTHWRPLGSPDLLQRILLRKRPIRQSAPALAMLLDREALSVLVPRAVIEDLGAIKAKPQGRYT